jgi:thioredoxin-related protein
LENLPIEIFRVSAIFIAQLICVVSNSSWQFLLRVFLYEQDLKMMNKCVSTIFINQSAATHKLCERLKQRMRTPEQMRERREKNIEIRTNILWVSTTSPNNKGGLRMRLRHTDRVCMWKSKVQRIYTVSIWVSNKHKILSYIS